MQEIKLSRGCHDTRDHGTCALEAVAWLAGEPHSDAPACVDSTLLRHLVIEINDGFETDEALNACLLPYVPKLLNTMVPYEDRLERKLVDVLTQELLPEVYRLEGVQFDGLPGMEAGSRVVLAAIFELKNKGMNPLIAKVVEMCRSAALRDPARHAVDAVRAYSRSDEWYSRWAKRLLDVAFEEVTYVS